MAVKNVKTPTTLMRIRLRSSNSGSDVHFKNVATSLANWEAVAGVPSEYSMTWIKEEQTTLV